VTDILDEVAQARENLRGAARRAIGVTGEADDAPPLRDAIRQSGVGWYPLVALGLLVVVDQFQGLGIFVLGPDISRSLGIGRSTLGFLIVIKTLMVMVASLPMAALVQRRARRASISIVTAVGWALATLFTGFVAGAWGLFVVLAADGASTGSVQAIHHPLLLDIYPPGARVRVLSTYGAAAAFGSVLAPLLVGLLSFMDFTWRGIFLVMGLVCVVAALGAVRLRDPGFGGQDMEEIARTVRGEDATAAVGDDAARLGFFEVIRRVLLITTARRLMIAWAVLGSLVFPLNTYLFFFLAETWHLGPGGRSLFFALMFAVAIPGLLWFGHNGENAFRQDPARLIRGVALLLVLISVGIGVAVSSPFFWVMVVAFGVVFAGASLLLPSLGITLLSLVPSTMRPHASAIGGIFFAGVGGAGGLLLLGGIDRRFGVGGAVVALALPGLIAALVLRQAARTVNDDLDQLVDALIEAEEVADLRARGAHLPMLACRHIDFSYGPLQVLFDVDFTVDDGEMVALLGTNGAGKSTLLRVISGLGLPTRGSVAFQGADVTYLDAERRLGLGITQIPGGRAVFPRLSVVDNLRVFGYSERHHRGKVDRGIDETFTAFPRLAERRNQLASTLSGGEQQMLALGKALILEPRLLLIDELSLGLAPVVVGELLEMVRRINTGGTAVVLVEQSVNIALSLVNHAYFMEKGAVRFDGKAADLLKRGDLLRSVFLQGAGKALATKNGRRR
jgi:ABC-type branched-subunit amino acid transport system ATPase component/MFS family permease